MMFDEMLLWVPESSMVRGVRATSTVCTAELLARFSNLPSASSSAKAKNTLCVCVICDCLRCGYSSRNKQARRKPTHWRYLFPNQYVL